MKRQLTGNCGPPACLRFRRRSGQTVIFLLMAFTILVFFMMFHVDLHRVIQRKSQAQNAGDAAVLAAARWQGATLNLIGELNLLHVLALAANDPDAVDAITNMQARLTITGPLAALYAAQVAAKNNRMYVDPAQTSLYMKRVGELRQLDALLSASGYTEQLWEGMLRDYADILAVICADGLAAGPDNARLGWEDGKHILLNREFYEAVAGASWCWFYLYQRGLLERWNGWDWDELSTEIDVRKPIKIFDLGLEQNSMPLANRFSAADLEEYITEAGLAAQITGSLAATGVTHSVETWYMYNRSDWTAWEDIKPDGEIAFPAAGEVRPHYDYSGADAVVRVSATVDRMMPEGRRGATGSATVNWTAAAKPFGYLDSPEGKVRPDNASGLVLPAFRDVRLIPVGTASNSDAFSSDPEWVIHVETHLRAYKDTGPEPGCPYCNAMVKFEQPSFRQAGIDWLAENSHKCRIPSGGGPRHGGGSPWGH